MHSSPEASGALLEAEETKTSSEAEGQRGGFDDGVGEFLNTISQCTKGGGSGGPAGRVPIQRGDPPSTALPKAERFFLQAALRRERAWLRHLKRKRREEEPGPLTSPRCKKAKL